MFIPPISTPARSLAESLAHGLARRSALAGIALASAALFCTAVALVTPTSASAAEAPAAEITAPAAGYSSSVVANLDMPSALAAEPGVAAGGQQERHYGAAPGWKQKVASNFALDFGGGFNAPHPDSTPYITWGGQFNIGAGYNFSPHLALLAEYQFLDDKLPGNLVAETGANGGNAHIWSLTFNPIYTLNPRQATQYYVTGGGGFYRKVTNFTDPVDVYYCDYYYCGIAGGTTVVGHFSSNQGGWSLGAGIQRRFGGQYSTARMKYYIEARYLQVNSPAITTQPNGLGTTTVGPDTKLIPVTVGIRW